MCLFASPKQWIYSIDIMKKEMISSDTPYQTKDLNKPYDQWQECTEENDKSYLTHTRDHNLVSRPVVCWKHGHVHHVIHAQGLRKHIYCLQQPEHVNFEWTSNQKILDMKDLQWYGKFWMN